MDITLNTIINNPFDQVNVEYFNYFYDNRMWRDLVAALSLVPIQSLKTYNIENSDLNEASKEYIQIIQNGETIPLPTESEVKLDHSSIYLYAYLRITTLDFLVSHLQSINRYDPFLVLPLLPTVCYILNLGHSYITEQWIQLLMLVEMYEEFEDVCRWVKSNNLHDTIEQALNANPIALSIYNTIYLLPPNNSVVYSCNNLLDS